MPAGDRLIKAMKDVAKKSNPSTNMTDVVYGVVQKAKPLTVLVDNRLELTEDFLLLSPFCYSTGFSFDISEHSHEISINKISVNGHSHEVEGKTSTTAGGFSSTPSANCKSAGSHKVKVTLWDDLKVGDKLVMLRIASGQSYMILYRDKLDVKVSVS